jgi:hypothetical protein
MPIAYQSVGAVTYVASANNTAFAPPLPATRPTGSLLLLVAHTRLTTATLTTPSGWTLLTGFPRTSTTTPSGGKLWVFGKEVVGGETAPSLAFTGPATGASGDNCAGFVICYSGVDVSSSLANVFDAAVQFTDAAGTTTCTYPAITTATNGAQIVRTLCRYQDLAVTFTPTASPVHAERVDSSTTNRTGSQEHLQDMTAATAGVQAAVTVAPSSNTSIRYIAATMALKPTAPTTHEGSATMAGTGTVTATSQVPRNGAVTVAGAGTLTAPGTVIGPSTIAAGRWGIEDMYPPTSRTLHAIIVRARKTADTYPATIKARLYEGSTTRSALYESALLTTTFADYRLALTDIEAAAIVNYANLEVEVSGHSTAGTPTIEITRVEFETPEAAPYILVSPSDGFEFFSG